jgi:hypothetical protein
MAIPLSLLRQVGSWQARYRHAVIPDAVIPDAVISDGRMTDVFTDVGVCSAIVFDHGQVEAGSNGSHHIDAL